MEVEDILCPKIPFLKAFHSTNGVADYQRLAVNANNKINYASKLNFKSEPAKFRRTQLIVTIPSSVCCEWLEKLFDLEIGGFQMKFSKFTKTDGQELLQKIIHVSELYTKKTGIKNTKILLFVVSRGGVGIGTLKSSKTNKVKLIKGKETRLTVDEDYREVVDDKTIFVDYDKLNKVLEPGNLVMFDKSLVTLRVDHVKDKFIYCIVEKGGEFRSTEKLVLPGVPIDLSKSFQLDEIAIEFGMEQKLDVFCLKGVIGKDDVLKVIKLVENNVSERCIMPRIDNFNTVYNVESILKVSDGIIIDSSKLLLELPEKKYTFVQKCLIELCRRAGKPVLLMTRIDNPKKLSKSEICDVANAVLDGIDAIILSEDNTCLETIQSISNICREAEAANYQKQFIYEEYRGLTNLETFSSLALGAAQAAQKCNAAAIIMSSVENIVPKLISNLKPRCPIIYITRHRRFGRYLKLYSGIIVIICKKKFTGDLNTDLKMRLSLGCIYGKYKGILRQSDAIVTISSTENDNTLQVEYVHQFEQFSEAPIPEKSPSICPCKRKPYKKICLLSDCLDIY